jgi:hypothetical protein
MLEGRDGHSHRGDPPDFPISAVWSAGSVDVQHGLTADAARHESVKRARRSVPRGFELDLAVQSPAGPQRAIHTVCEGLAGRAAQELDVVPAMVETTQGVRTLQTDSPSVVVRRGVRSDVPAAGR